MRALVWCSLALACASHPPVLVAPSVDPALRVPMGQKVVLRSHARGVQIYACRAAAEAPDHFTWTLVAPQAELAGEGGQKIGTHYAGPTWEAVDGSRVSGEVQRRAPAPSAEDIPWLLLQAKSSQGRGILSGVTFIQRVDTRGGKAPDDGCDAARAGAERRVDYTATYYFYARAQQE
jgi:hypothetical protein